MAREAIAYYWEFYSGRKLALLLTSALLVMQPVALMVTLHTIKSQFDSSLQQGRLLPLVLVCFGLVGLYVFSGGLALYVRYRMMQLTHQVINQLRREIVNRLYAFSRKAYARFDRKELQTVLVQDVIRVDIMTNAFAGQLIPGLVIAATMTVFLLSINPALFAILACLFPALVILERVLRPMLKKLVRGHHQALEEWQKKTLFGLEALDLTHTRGSSQGEIETQVDAGGRFRLVSTRLALFRETIGFAQDVLMLITSILCLLLGAWFVTKGSMTPGALLAFYMAVLVMRPHLRTCWATLPEIVQGVESLQTINRWMHLPDEPPRFGQDRIAFTGEVDFHQLCFSYNHQPLLRGIDLHIPAGTTATILGPNGVGKSTLAYLLLGFYAPRSGEIRVDGKALQELAIAPFRQQIGVVPQHPLIFQGTILENITYGAPQADDRAIAAASRLACADEFIRVLADGYNSLAGDDGMLLSGGQRQRIAIARALLSRPPLLILDEPSTYLDVQSIGKIMSGLRRQDYRPTILLITHDTALARYGDATYRLEDGILSRQPDLLRQSV